jgi:hypothetical protein
LQVVEKKVVKDKADLTEEMTVEMIAEAVAAVTEEAAVVETVAVAAVEDN